MLLYELTVRNAWKVGQTVVRKEQFNKLLNFPG